MAQRLDSRARSRAHPYSARSANAALDEDAPHGASGVPADGEASPGEGAGDTELSGGECCPGEPMRSEADPMPRTWPSHVEPEDSCARHASAEGEHRCRWRALPAVPASARAARVFVTEVLGDWGLEDLAYDAATIASELATNAIVHAPSSGPAADLFHIALTVDASRLTMTVSDRVEKAPAPPFPGEPDDDAESGRGLGIVEAYSDEWGWHRNGPTGKLVWATLKLAGRA